MLAAATAGLPPQEKLEIKAVSVPLAKVNTAEGIAFYHVQVRGSFNVWSVAKRYSQFEELHTGISTLKGFPAACELPPKKYKLFTSHNSSQFLEERRVLLENYLKKVLGVVDIANSETFLKFLTTDKVAAEQKTAAAPATGGPAPAADGKVKDQKAAGAAAGAATAAAPHQTSAHVPHVNPNGMVVTTTAPAEKEMPEDVEVTGVLIPATRTMSDHVLYQIDCINTRKRKSFQKWTVLKRYSQFYDMDTAVRTAFLQREDILAVMPSAPARQAKLLTDHMDNTFVEQRRVLLENYLQKMIKVEAVVRHPVFLLFLGVKPDS